MDQKALKLCQDNDRKCLRQFLEDLKPDEVLDIVTKFMENDYAETVMVMRAILEGKRRENFQEHTVALYIHVCKLLNENKISPKMSSNIIGFLLIEVEVLSVHSLIEMVDYLISTVRSRKTENGKPLELLPKILAILSNSKLIQLADDGEMSGDNYKHHILNTICSCRWNPKMAVPVASMLREMDITQEELSFVIKKLTRMLFEVNLQDAPALCYQALLTSSKGQKRLLLDGLCSFVNEKDTESEQTNALLRQTKGTIILHVTFAVKQDQDLGREFLKFLKSSQSGKEYDKFTPFNISLALAISTIKRLEDGIFEYLKSTILKAYKEDERRSKSFWFQEIYKQACKIDDVITSILLYSKHGWDDVVQGLTQFGFMLLDSYNSKQNELYDVNNPVTPAQKTCSLGAKILEGVFKDQDFLREEIVSHILNTVATQSNQNTSHFIDILAALASKIPQVMLDCLPKIKEVFDYISLLTPSAAEGILHAVLPLMKISMTMKDSLILVLRKAMFSRQEESRKIAVTGFLLILKHFKIPFEQGSMVCSSQFASTQLYTCSQVEVAASSRLNSSIHEPLCMEILGNLRRCLTHQCDVRLQLYEGLFEVVSKNQKLTYNVLDLLVNQFRRYYEENEDIQAPLKLELCISCAGGTIALTEPLASLLNCLQLCTKKSGLRLDREDDEDEPLSNLLDDVEEILKSMTKRMIKADLEDFELDKAADFNTASSVGMKNNFYARIVDEVYEVLIEYNWMRGNYSEESATDIIKLFDNKQKFNDLLTEKSSNSSGKRSKASTTVSKQRASLLSFKCLASFIEAIFCDTDIEHEKGIQPLRETLTFSKFIINSILHKLNQILETKFCDGLGGGIPSHLIKRCCSIARTFLFQINGDTCLSENLLEKDKSQRFTTTCFEGLYMIVCIVCSHFRNHLTFFLNSLEFSANLLTQNSENDNQEEVIHRHLCRFQRMTLNIFVSPGDDIRMKDGHILINIMTKLTDHLDSTKISQVYTWLHQVCSEYKLEDPSVVKALLSPLLTLHRKSKSKTNLVREISQDIHSQLGDIDEEIEVEHRDHFPVINATTVAPHVFLLFLSHIDKLLDENEWVLAKLRAESSLRLNEELDKDKNDNFEETESERERIEESLCHRTIGLVTSFHELVQSAFPEGTTADIITKALTKLYGFLGSFAKYHLNLYSQKIGRMTIKFEKLVKLTGTHLTQQAYAMITYMQASQSMADESMQNKMKRGKTNRQHTVQKIRAIKESKMIPNLIYAIEQYERYLIQLSKKSKVTNLMEHFKLSTSRDFRINGATLEAALHETEEGGEEEEEKEQTAEVLK